MTHGEQADDLFRYYWQELAYLKRMGGLFARRHPDVAARLELEADGVSDPHVERLVECFAFLTGRLQRDIDDDFPEIAVEFLNLLHPHYLHPIPSMTIARFEVDPERGKLTTGFDVPAGTPLFTHPTADSSSPAAMQPLVCRFRTCYPLTLWPVEVVEAAFESADDHAVLAGRGVGSVLRLRLESRADPLAELAIDRLRFYLDGERLLVSALYEILFGKVRGVALVPDGEGPPHFLPAEAILAVGFGVDDEVLPYPHQSQPAYRLLHEYFVFPEKYFFFDLEGLARAGGERHLDLLFLLDEAPDLPVGVDRANFVLGCTPVINLFAKTSEPIRIEQRQWEYRLVPDQRHERTSEIYRVLSVYGIGGGGGDVAREYRPFFSFDHQMERADHRAFWHARRRPTALPDAGGTDVHLSFVDLDFQPELPPSEAVYARCDCTNRKLAEQIPAGGLLQSDQAMPVARIHCLKKPSQVIWPPLAGQALWRLVSHLSLNHLSLTEGVASVKALREVLKLYSFSEEAAVQQQVLAVHDLICRRTVRRVGSDAWRGFCRGTEVTVVFDEDLIGSRGFLLGAVLNRFFALYGTTNHFTETVVKSRQREGEWKRWPPLAGEKMLL
jgi:type VI secretion system protein ImpG